MTCTDVHMEVFDVYCARTRANVIQRVFTIVYVSRYVTPYLLLLSCFLCVQVYFHFYSGKVNVCIKRITTLLYRVFPVVLRT